MVVGTDAEISWFRDMSVSGFATIVISLGILGEYVARIYDEIKRRSAYLVQ